MRDDAAAELRALNEVIERLRAPGGCPWDRQQTHASLAPFLLEETYEALDAVEQGEAALREELGDVLLQVLMHSAIAAEHRDAGDGFDIGDVAADVRRKMIHRHPHVFGDVEVTGADDVVLNWEKLKAAERGGAPRELLAGIPAALPSLALAQAMQKRVARVGFDPSGDIGTVAADVHARLDALAEHAGAAADGDDPDADADADADAVAADQAWVATDGGFARGAATVSGDAVHRTSGAAEDAVAELLFAVVVLARRLHVDAELALRKSAHRFAERFARAEKGLHATGRDVHDVSAAEWDDLWRTAGVTDAAD